MFKVRKNIDKFGMNAPALPVILRFLREKSVRLFYHQNKGFPDIRSNSIGFIMYNVCRRRTRLSGQALIPLHSIQTNEICAKKKAAQ